MLFASPNCLLHVATKNSPIVYTVIHFWLLLTQPVSVTTTMASASNNNYYDIAFSEYLPLPTHMNTADFDARQQLLQQQQKLLLPPTSLMDKTLTYCDTTNKDNTNWRPVCATTNSVDYVLFSSECLLQQTNRVQGHHHVSYTGETQPVFRKIAMGLCRPNCSVVIFESSEEPICVQNLRNDEVRLFSGHSEMARDVCLHENEWQPISDEACISTDDLLPIDPTNSSTAQNAAIPTTKTNNSTSIQPTTENKSSKDSSNDRKKLSKKVLKSIPCPKIFNPVCAELFGVKATFINECLVNAENVKFGKNWQIFSEGVCAEDYASSEGRKNIIKKRSISDSATVTYKLHTPDRMGLNGGKLLWSNDGNLYYLNPSVMDVYGRQMQSAQQYTLRIFPNVDERVTECRFGVGPVCGSSSNRTVHEFQNICELILRNAILNETWSVVNEQKCASKKCTLNCTTNYDPFCISRNGVNYTIINQCHVDYAFCRYKNSDLKILGKGECKQVLETIAQMEKVYALSELSQSSSHPNEKYSLRLVRKIVDSSQQKGESSNSLSSLLLQNGSAETVTEDPVEFVIAPKTSLQSSAESLIESSTRRPQNSTTATIKPNGAEKDSVTESHIMILWRSSKLKSDK